MRSFLWFIVVTSVVITIGCLDAIDLDVPQEEQGTIVIQGKLIKKNDEAQVDVRINNLFDFTPQSRLPVLVRTVELFETNGGVKMLERTDLNTYSITIDLDDPDFPIEYGNEYWIRVVTLRDQIFISQPNKLLKVPAAKELRFEYQAENPNQEEDRVKFFLSGNIDTNVDERKSRLRFSIKQAYRVTDCESKLCYVENLSDLNNIRTLDGNLTSDASFEDFEIHDVAITSLFAEGHYLSVFTESLSDEALRYWEEAATLVLRTGNMFEEPVGTQFSNITPEDTSTMDNVFGFFYATEIDTIRVYADSSLVGSPRPACPPLKPKEPNCLPCCDCLGLTNSSLTKPDFWIN
ncbi:MAG: DUF4249 family protein [Saprospiraceae bacterium]|nr:DUF4249 family protein [Saprospiraceae bacterium]